MGALQQALIASAGGAPFVGPLDGHTTGLFFACGLQRLLSSYVANAAIRVRRSSDNAEQDIGFSGGSLDTTSLATFVGANSAFVTKWYDQSGANNDIGQATAGQQPRIVNAGVYDANLVFDATDDCMTSLTSVPAGTGMTYVAKQTLRSLAATIVLAEYSTNYNLTDAAILYWDSAQVKQVASIHGGAAGYATVNFPLDTAEHVCAWRVDRTQVSGPTEVVEYLDAVAVSGTDASTGPLPSGNFASTTWHIASRNETLLFAPLSMKTLVLYSTAISDAEMAAVSTALA